MRLLDFRDLLISVILCYAVAVLGSLLTVPAIDNWYASLAKPSWTPPNWLFTPVWLTLFLMIAISNWMIWRRRREAAVRVPLVLTSVQLALNITWSGLFFALQSPGLALVEIALLWLAILFTIISFWRVHRLAAVLLGI